MKLRSNSNMIQAAYSIQGADGTVLPAYFAPTVSGPKAIALFTNPHLKCEYMGQ